MMVTVSGGGDVVVERDGDIALVILDRPNKHNALSLAMWEALPGVVADLAGDAGVLAVILTGRGDAAFSAGADIAEFAEIFADEAGAARFNAAVLAANQALVACAKPVIAMVRGLCVGGGCGLALHCDLRFAAESARFAITPARLGFVYPFSDTGRLVAQIGPSRAKDMLFSARFVAAEEALRIGLVDRVVPDAELSAATLAYVRGMAGLSQYTVRASKRIIDSIGAGLGQEEPVSAAYLAGAATGADFIEGRTAFLAGRRPRFGWRG